MTRSAVHSLLSRHWGWKLVLLGLWLAGVAWVAQPVVSAHTFATLHKILKKGEISFITRNSPECYYTYRDQPMGFEYELAREFAAYLGVRLKVVTADSWEAMLKRLKHGSGAVIAASMPITAKRRKQVAFSVGYMEIQPLLVVGRNHSSLASGEDLAGKTVHVRKSSDLHELLEHIRRQGVAVDIRADAGLPAEELIRRVADGTIGITVAHSHIAMLNRRHYPEAVTAAAIGEAQWLGWAVDPRARELLSRINHFFDQVMKNGRFDEIYAKYYSDIHEFDYVDLRTFHRRIRTRLSRYSPFIKEAARKNGFDWRLIAAQIYQESHLHPWANSTAGAKGLMQLLPETAASLGVTDLFDPVENIDAGVRHLKNLYDQFEDIGGEDRLLLALAAYNTGIGHVQDARKLAARNGLDPNRWESLSETLPLLKYPRYYEKAAHGYCRGDEPVAYIKQIMIYYDILKRRGIEYATGG